MGIVNEISEKELLKAKDRATKLMKLATNNDNENESQNAMLKAQQILFEAGLSVDDLNNKNINKVEKAIKSHERPVTDYITLQFWHKSLADVIANNFRCYYWIETDYKIGKKRIMFFGLKQDTNFAKDVYQFAMKSIENCATHYIRIRDDLDRNQKKATKNTYMLGYIQGLSDKFNKQVIEKGYQLVLVRHPAVVDQYAIRSEDFVNLKASKFKTASDNHARAAGYEEGSSFDLAMGKRTITKSGKYDLEVRVEYDESIVVHRKINDAYSYTNVKVDDIVLIITDERSSYNGDMVKITSRKENIICAVPYNGEVKNPTAIVVDQSHEQRK